MGEDLQGKEGLYDAETAKKITDLPLLVRTDTLTLLRAKDLFPGYRAGALKNYIAEALSKETGEKRFMDGWKFVKDGNALPYLQRILDFSNCTRGYRKELTRKAEHDFFSDHLGSWAPAFASRILSANPHPFFRAAALMLEAWIARERERLLR